MPRQVTSKRRRLPPVPDRAPVFVRDVTARMAGRGDEPPVSALPIDGTYPSGRAGVGEAQHRAGHPALSPTCASSAEPVLVCPHGVIRAKFPRRVAARRRAGISSESAPIDARGFPDVRYTLQVYAEDCTGCALC
ncbi:MAG: hypothetical protein U0270_37805 [Labilithrix sp.]